jgi:hypothetical protein
VPPQENEKIPAKRLISLKSTYRKWREVSNSGVQFGNLANFVGSPILAAVLLRWGWVSVGMYLLAGALVVLASLMVLRRY